MKTSRVCLALILFSFMMTFPGCQQEIKDETEPVSLDQPGIIAHEDAILFQFPELPSIMMNQPEISIPEASLGVLDSIIDYMAANPDPVLHISGFYGPDEDGVDGFENMGLARADHLANQLMVRGADGSRIKIHAEMKDLSFDEEGMLLDGYRLAIKQAEVKVAGAYDRTILFWAAERLIRFDEDLKDYIPAVKKYMEEQPGLKMVLTGHTDFNGNHLLGKMRAEALAEYFALYGIDTSRVVIRSEGPDKPVAPNDTQENKDKNRRVEVTFE